MNTLKLCLIAMLLVGCGRPRSTADDVSDCIGYHLSRLQPGASSYAEIAKTCKELYGAT